MAPVPERGYPLSALFLLIAACAIPIAMSTAAGRAMAPGNSGPSRLLLASLWGSTATMLLGTALGLHHYRPGLGIIAGGMAGAIVGSMAGPMVLASKEDFPTMIALAGGGSVVLVIGAAWIHASTQRLRANEPPAWFREEHPFREGERE